MPRAAKKIKKENGDGDAGPSTIKKARLSGKDGSGDQIAGRTVRWEWEGDKGVWTNYGSMNSQICDAFNNKEKQFEFEVGTASLLIKFDNMVQKNKKTGWERRVRCAVKDEEDGVFYIWQWEDERGKLNPYSAEICLQLEKAKEEGETEVSITACNRSYTVDLEELAQINTVTNVTKPVKRAKAVSVDPAEDATPSAINGAGSSGDASAKKSGGRAVKVKEEPVEEPSTKSGKAKAKSGGKAAKSGRSGAEGEGETKVKTVVLSGKAPVDAECTTLAGKVHVYSEGKDIWDTMLNQTNTANNNNKYYLIQLLEENNKKAFYVWQRWGRVGYGGQNSLVPCGGDIDKAKRTFCKKFSDKTKNDWSDRKNFEKVPGKYDMLEMDYSAKDADEDETDAAGPSQTKDDVPDSKLDKKIQDLINLICDVKSMENAVVEMKYDAKKAPLGKLTADQVKAGYAALKKIDNCISNGDFGPTLTRACDEFYTRIPHDFGMKQPPVIRTKEVVELKMQLLEALEDIQIAIKTLKKGDRSENPVDRHYHAIKCEMDPLDHKSEDFKLVDMYMQNTHATTHNQYKLQVLEVFELDKYGESDAFKDFGNRQLLWHGSRLTNWVGILSNGLRIAPPEAPVTGYMFGKGVYFADMSSKSANYCFATKTKNVALILLCEVSLGKTNDLLNADYSADKLPAGKNSVKGLGRIGPDPANTKTLSNGTLVPLGKGKDTGVKNPSGYTLNYNEFIVYDTKQIKMKYLVQVKFNFK